MGEDSEGAGGIKGHTPNSGRVNVVLIQDTLHGIADTSPYVRCRLFLCRRSD